MEPGSWRSLGEEPDHLYGLSSLHGCFKQSKLIEKYSILYTICREKAGKASRELSQAMLVQRT